MSKYERTRARRWSMAATPATYHALTIAFLQFAHLRGHLNAEMDLVAVLTDHLQLDVFGVVVTSFHIVLRVLLHGNTEVRRKWTPCAFSRRCAVDRTRLTLTCDDDMLLLATTDR